MFPNPLYLISLVTSGIVILAICHASKSRQMVLSDFKEGGNVLAISEHTSNVLHLPHLSKWSAE